MAAADGTAYALTAHSKPLSTDMPKSKSTPTVTHDKGDTDNIDTIPMPTWNTSPNTLPAYVLALRRWLPTRNPKYLKLIQRGG